MTPETENEQLRTRMGEMAAEIERLQSVIDAANAQDPCGYQIFSSVHGWVTADEDTFNLRVVDNFAPVRKIYARPIPAQQTIDRDTIINVLLSIGNMSEGIIADAIISAIGAQQSPAVAVQICDECDIANCKHVRDKTMQIIANPSTFATDHPTELEMHRADYKAIKSAGFESPGELLAAYNYLLSNRITEQDAREIAVAYALHRGTEYNKGYAEMFVDQFFATSEGRALLNKLNGAKNAQ